MLSLILALSSGVVVFIIAMLFMPKDDARIQARRRERIELLQQQQVEFRPSDEYTYTFDDAMHDLSPLGQKIVYIPGAAVLYRLMVQAGYQQKAHLVGMALAVFMGAVTFFLVYKFGALGLIIGLCVTYFISYKFLIGRVEARNRQFIEKFADAIDMIVRAIRSGNPVNSAFRLVAEHGESPVAEEFKRLVDEITYGRVLTEALARLAKRVPEQDVSFFVVVLTVQQETGGNLGEILSKLSHIIRKRKELMLKVRAITAEGRMTSWILGSLPFFEFGALYLMSPEFIEPLLTTSLGNILLGISVGLVAAGMWVINQMIKIEV